MKKILIVLFAVSTIAATSCKKDNETAPIKTNKAVSFSEKSNVGSWD
jgi:hypothetical protein